MLTVKFSGVVYNSALAQVESTRLKVVTVIIRVLKEVKVTPVGHGLSLIELGPAQPMHIREIIDGLSNLICYKYKRREKL